MKTVGTMLKEARIAKRLTLGDIERATKIRMKFLTAIEADDYRILPSTLYAKGFVKNYAEFIGLNSRTVMAFFRRQTEDIPKSSLLPKGMSEPLNRPLLQLTPGRFLGILIIGLLGVFLLYFALQYTKLHQSPLLLIESPLANQTINEKRIDVIGMTDPDATVTVNGVSVLVRSDGKFFEQVELTKDGENDIAIVVTSRYGKVTKKDIQVNRVGIDAVE